MVDKKELSLILSRIETFEKPKVQYEQYQTPSELAATALWKAYMDGSIKDKSITDLGCGTGIFGIGALILGAKRVVFVDADKDALNVARKNKVYIEKLVGKKLNADFFNKDVAAYKGKSDVVIQNPPFGVKKPHIDKLFLDIAMNTAPVIYSFHKIESKEFIEKFVEDNRYKVKEVIRLRFPLKA